MKNILRGGIVLWMALLGAALGASVAAWYSVSQPAPESPFRNQDPNPPAEARPTGAVDPILVVDGAVCGFVLGAGLGAVARRRATPTPARLATVSSADTGTDAERFRADLRRRIVAHVNFAGVTDAEYEIAKETLRAELLRLANQFVGQVPIQLDPAEEEAAVAQLVDEMLTAYEQNLKERAAMGRPKE